MNRRFCLLALLLVSLSAACASADKKDTSSENTEEIVFDDGINTAKNEIVIADKNEIVIADNDFKEDKASSTPVKVYGETTKIVADGSQINTMFDRYGNKAETRYFNYDSRLKFVLLRTSGDGQKQVFIYGQNGEVKSLPEDMLDKVLTAPANEIAAAAGINEGSITRSVGKQQPSAPLTPLPSSAFPIRTPQREIVVPTETGEPEKTEPVEPPKPMQDTSNPPKKNPENYD